MHLITRDLSQTRRWLSEEDRAGILHVIAASFDGVVPADYLAKYFDHPDPFERKLRLYFHDARLVGYCLLTFTDEAGDVIIRASAGFLPDFRQSGQTFGFSIRQSVLCWLRRPWRQVYYADTMLSPAMYRAIAKHSGVVWPHADHDAPAALFERFNAAGMTSDNSDLRCLLRVGRATRYSQSDIDAFLESEKPEIRYFCSLNPRFMHGVALFVIMPINLQQCWRSLLKRVGFE